MPIRPASAAAQVGYSVSTAAERLGMPTATLRTWNRRYGIGPSQRHPRQHRLYTDADLVVLARMRELIGSGATAAGAAAAVRGTVIALGDTAALLDAAFALAAERVCDLLERHIRAYGVIETWDRLCRPAFSDVLTRQLRGESCVDVEHLLSWCVLATLHRAAPPTPDFGDTPRILACTSGETHSLPMEVLRVALAERGTGARMLGPDVPTAALADTLGRVPRGAAVMLWSQRESTASTSAVRACTSAGAAVYVGGPGWNGVTLPGAVARIADLTEAVDRLT
ncbi:MerR family transcriptional regulator [Nocardia sp. NPDC051832]|uniref:MerR family transcriptional regulator n=1 Tax=Nocardia sp. NPDC051832 TaxID=3155673 RepID=UPI0034128764